MPEFVNEPPVRVDKKVKKTYKRNWWGHVKEDGTPHGIGRYSFMVCFIYEGILVNGEMSGFGRLEWPDGSFYLG